MRRSDRPGLPTPERHRRIVERRARRILRAADDGEQRVERRGRRLVDRRVLRGPDVQVQVGRHADQRRARGWRARKRPRRRRRRRRPRPRSTARPSAISAVLPSPVPIEQRPDARHDRHLRPTPAAGRPDRRPARPRRVDHEEGDDGGTGQQREQVVADRDAGQVDDEQQQPPRPRLPAPAPPQQRQPGHRRDRERGDGVHLGLVASSASW